MCPVLYVTLAQLNSLYSLLVSVSTLALTHTTNDTEATSVKLTVSCQILPPV